MKAQINFEAETRTSWKQAFSKKSLRKRFILGALAMSGTQFSGLIVILSEYLRRPCSLLEISWITNTS
jgi:hypothetical protein